MKKLHVIQAGKFKLDGGAMFGVVPKRLWNKLNPADDQNLCTWSLRCLLLETKTRRILFDTGMGTKQDERFRSHFQPHGDTDLLSSLSEKGFEPEDITDVFLTHFHFDHVGGAITKTKQGTLVPTFPNAKYWSNDVHYQWAIHPNDREKASFLKENFVPLYEHNVLNFIEVTQNIEWLEGIRVQFVYGHTEAMMIPIIPMDNRTVVFCADLLPSVHHVRMPYVMAYDIRPLETLKEKYRFFEEAIQGDYHLFLEHDPVNTCCKIIKNNRGRFEGKLCPFQ